MILFHYVHGNFQITGWGAFWAVLLFGGTSVIVRHER